MTSRSNSAVLQLTMVIAVGWVLAFWPARMLRPESGVQWMSIAAGCSLVSGWIVVLLEKFAVFHGDMKLIMGQMCVRFLSLVIPCLVVKWLRPQFGIVDFYGWVIWFYLIAMVTEVHLLQKKFANKSSSTSSEHGTGLSNSSIGKL